MTDSVEDLRLVRQAEMVGHLGRPCLTGLRIGAGPVDRARLAVQGGGTDLEDVGPQRVMRPGDLPHVSPGGHGDLPVALRPHMQERRLGQLARRSGPSVA